MLRFYLLPVFGAALLTLSPLRADTLSSGTANIGQQAQAPTTVAADASALLDTLLFNADTRTETVRALLATGESG